MDKYYEIHPDLGTWDVHEISRTLQSAVEAANINFLHWKGTAELLMIDKSPTPVKLHHNPTAAMMPMKITNGDINLTTNLTHFTSIGDQLFCGSGKRSNIISGKEAGVPFLPDRELSTLIPFFEGTIVEDLHKKMIERFQSPIRIRCQNRTVWGVSQGLYWHKDDPVENRYHIPLWTNPGHLLLFTERNFKWKAGFDPVESMEPMTVTGHYLPADGRVYEVFTKDYMHAVASVGVGWAQPRTEQTRCHLSFWKAGV